MSRACPGVDRQQVLQHVSGNPKRHQRGQPSLQLVQLRGRPTARWPTETGSATTAASAQEPRKPQSHLAEQRCNPVWLPAVRPNRRRGGGLIGDNLVLNLHQQLLRFGQRQTQVGDVAKTIRPGDRHHLVTPGSTINPQPNKT
jgi:hypothetical protein